MILGLDVGTKSTGVAISDDEGRVAVGRGTLTGAWSDMFSAIRALALSRSIKRIVVGLPLALSGKETEQTTLTRSFVQQLQQHVSVPVVLHDERLTSVEAKRQSRERIDERSAILMLQSYLDLHNQQRKELP